MAKKVEKKATAKKAVAKKAPAKKAVEKKTPAKKAPAKKVAKQAADSTRVYHVVKRADGKWEVKFAGGEKAIKLFSTQVEAVAYSKEMAKHQNGAMLVHNSKGQNKGRIKSK